MSESRQQRRARERAEAKASNRRSAPPRSGPPERPQPSRRAAVLEVELSRFAAPDDPSEVTWSATWGLQGAEVGTEDSAEDLAELVTIILADAQPLGDKYEVRIEWTLGGDRPNGKPIADVIADCGVTLPDRLPAHTGSGQAEEVKVYPSPAASGTSRVSTIRAQSYPVTGTSGRPKSGS